MSKPKPKSKTETETEKPASSSASTIPLPIPSPTPSPTPDAAVEPSLGTGEEPEPWYRDGLSFSCTRCGACCTGAPGFVWVELEDIDAIAAHVGMVRDDFTRKYVRQVGERYSLVERPGGDCIFWDHTQGCTVYPVRPTQCRTWPFWSENIESPETWEGVQQVCPGSGRGQWFGIEDIRSAAARTKV